MWEQIPLTFVKSFRAIHSNRVRFVWGAFIKGGALEFSPSLLTSFRLVVNVSFKGKVV